MGESAILRRAAGKAPSSKPRFTRCSRRSRYQADQLGDRAPLTAILSAGIGDPASTKPSPNFAYLAHHDARLVALATQAEEHFAGDPTVTLFKLRQFGEVLAQRAAAKVGLFMAPRKASSSSSIGSGSGKLSGRPSARSFTTYAASATPPFTKAKATTRGASPAAHGARARGLVPAELRQ